MGDNDKRPEPVLTRLSKHTRKKKSGCWIWTGTTVRSGRLFYGRTHQGSKREGNFKQVLVHRLGYETLVGPIPEGMTLDHLCRNTLCWNPEHLEPCSLKENVARSPLAVTSINKAKKRCPKCGGRYTKTEKGRHCRPCLLDYYREYNATRR